jgi:hypothetical protein
MIEAGIASYLETFPGLVAVQDDRVWPGKLPQNPTLPATVYQRISTMPQYSHSGDSGLDEIIVQFTCWAKTPIVAKAAAAQVRSALSGYRGVLPDGTQIGGAWIENQRENDDPETGLFREMLDVRFQATV